jgi:competence protein ComEC
MHAPATVAAVPFLAGSLAGLLLWPWSFETIRSIGPGAAALALLAAAAWAADADGPGVCVAVAVGCFAAAFTCVGIAADRSYAPPLLRWFAARSIFEPVTLEGVLREDAVPNAAGVSLSIDVDRVDGQPAAGGVRLSVAGAFAAASSAEWRAGRRLRLPALLRSPSVHRSPGVPDEASALARRGICLVGSVKSAALIERVGNGSWRDEAAAAARAWARARLEQAVGPSSGRSAAIATAILIGDRSRLDREDERRLQAAGTYHVIAISGGNIAILAALLMLSARALRIPHSASAVLTIAALLFYNQMTGAAPSVARAVTAAVIFLAARLVDHRAPPLNALAVAGLFAVAWSPVAILDPGFILSFGATLGILLGVPILLGDRHPIRGRRGRRLVHATQRAALAVLAATICAEIALAPVGASLFGRVTFAGLLLNFVAIPLMTVVQLAGGTVLLVPAFWTAGSAWLAWLAHAAATGLVESARFVDLVPWLSVPVSPPSWQMLVLYYLAATASLFARLRRWAIGCVVAAGAIMVAGPADLARDAVRPSRYPLRAVVLDVGQGDATLVTMSGRHAVLVDTGGIASYSVPDADAPPGFDIGERVVGPALRALGVFRLDALVLTHGDPDHILGAPAILTSPGARSVWEGVPVPRHAGLQALRRLAIEGGATWRTVQAADAVQFGDVEVRVLHPPPPDWERQRVRNEDSVVLEVRLGQVSLLLAGDIGREGEHAILSRLEPGRLTVLKAGHHGSATSSTAELLAALRPAGVIFSAGRDNRFGHPHPAVVARFEAMGTAIFRTDQDGAVFIETDGRTVQMKGWTGRSMLIRDLTTDAGARITTDANAYTTTDAGARITTDANAYTTTRRHDGTKE